MKVDGGIGTSATLDGIREAAQEQEAAGYDGLWVPETSHDPFVPLTLIADATESVDVGTNIAVAFARNPLDLA
jgi:alkanesulfonate monooxygenase SsuD/methylene tetrahydromethanopterin reductase-like flavin-dependent oxidoreductase (luciferase family)